MPFKSELSVTFQGDHAYLDRPLVYSNPKLGEIVVMTGFKTDFASVPGWILLPGIIPKIGRIRWAAVIHDWIYQGKEGRRFTRSEADRILYDVAVEQKMSRWRARLAWLGVRIGGWIVWNRHHG